jgi:hypothetical protein
MSRRDGYDDDVAELRVHSTTYGILRDPIRGRLSRDQCNWSIAKERLLVEAHAAAWKGKATTCDNTNVSIAYMGDHLYSYSLFKVPQSRFEEQFPQMCGVWYYPLLF